MLSRTIAKGELSIISAMRIVDVMQGRTPSGAGQVTMPALLVRQRIFSVSRVLAANFGPVESSRGDHQGGKYREQQKRAKQKGVVLREKYHV